MSFDEVRSFVGVAGLLIFIALFVGVLIYTFWPGNRKRFERARHIPLDDDSDDSSSRGENGR
jgi:cytochrome c oxidase cbb3-type subunit 4